MKQAHEGMIISGAGSEKDERDPHLRMAADWFAALRLGRGDATAFEAWRAQDPRHALAFARVSAAWDKLQDMDPVPIGAATDSQHAAAGHFPSRRAMLRGAGLIGVGLVAGIGLIEHRAEAWSTGSTDVGQRKRIRLPGGSYAGLDTDTAIAWRDAPGKRTIRLDRGEITLTIAQGPTATLLCGNARAALTAGLYDVRAETDGMRLLVLSGTAEMIGMTGESVPRSGGSAPVARDRQALVVRDGQVSVDPVPPKQMAAALAWQQGEIVFDDVPLGTAIADYNRYLRRKLVLREPGLGAQRVGGRFLTHDVAPFLAALQASLDIAVTQETDRFILYRRKSSM